MKHAAIICLFLIALTACATKQYPQAAKMMPYEADAFSCRDIRVEIIKTKSVQEEIERTGEFDGLTVLGFLGDFGIGNQIAKDTARKKVEDRLQTLQTLEQKKCRKEQAEPTRQQEQRVTPKPLPIRIGD